MGTRTQEHDEEFEGRIFRITIGVCSLVSIVLALMFFAAGGIGLFALIKFVFG